MEVSKRILFCFLLLRIALNPILSAAREPKTVTVANDSEIKTILAAKSILRQFHILHKNTTDQKG